MDMQKYEKIIQSVSGEIAAAIIQNENDLIRKISFFDSDVAELTRNIGLKTTEMILTHLTDETVKQKQSWF